MVTLRRDVFLNAPADRTWISIRSFDQVHIRVAPGFVSGLKMDDGDRLVTFFNGLVARERLVTCDDEARRLVYTVVAGRASHYSAALEVASRDIDHCLVVWTIDLLPDDLAPFVAGMMDQAVVAMRRALEANRSA